MLIDEMMRRYQIDTNMGHPGLTFWWKKDIPAGQYNIRNLTALNIEARRAFLVMTGSESRMLQHHTVRVMYRLPLRRFSTSGGSALHLIPPGDYGTPSYYRLIWFAEVLDI